MEPGITRWAVPLGWFAMTASAALAQAQRPNDPDLAPCGIACGGCGFLFVVTFVAIIILNVVLLIWVARDAKARGMDNEVLWMILVLAMGPVGLIIYIFSRPQGALAKCPNCSNMRLQASVTCPHCGAS